MLVKQNVQCRLSSRLMLHAAESKIEPPLLFGNILNSIFSFRCMRHIKRLPMHFPNRLRFHRHQVQKLNLERH